MKPHKVFIDIDLAGSSLTERTFIWKLLIPKSSFNLFSAITCRTVKDSMCVSVCSWLGVGMFWHCNEWWLVAIIVLPLSYNAPPATMERQSFSEKAPLGSFWRSPMAYRFARDKASPLHSIVLDRLPGDSYCSEHLRRVQETTHRTLRSIRCRLQPSAILWVVRGVRVRLMRFSFKFCK